MATGPVVIDIGPCNCCGGGSCYYPEGATCVVEWDAFLGIWVDLQPCQGRQNPDGTGPICATICSERPDRLGAYQGERLTFSCN